MTELEIEHSYPPKVKVKIVDEGNEQGTVSFSSPSGLIGSISGGQNKSTPLVSKPYGTPPVVYKVTPKPPNTWGEVRNANDVTWEP